MVPLWWFVVSLAIIAILVLLHVVRTHIPLPLFDKGSAIFCAKDEKAQRTLALITRAHGLPPRLTANSKLAKRLILSNGWILNVPLLQDYTTVGSALALRSSDPLRDAKAAIKILTEMGYSAIIDPHPDPDMANNLMVAVRTDALVGNTLLIFRVETGKMPRPSLVTAHDVTPYL